MQRAITPGALMLREQPCPYAAQRSSRAEIPRIGVTIMAPLIPVAVFTFDWPRAVHPHAITNTRTSTRADIVIYPLFRNPVVEANIRVNAACWFALRGERFCYCDQRRDCAT